MGLSFDDARFAQYMRRISGHKQAEPLTALPDVFPVMVLAGSRVEDHFLRGERLYCRGLTSPAVAAQYSFATIENPIDPGGTNTTLVVIDVIHLRTSAYASVYPGATIGAASSKFVRDTRVGPTGVQVHGVAHCYIASNAISGSNPESLLLQATDDLEDCFVLAPGSRLEFQSPVVNQELGLNVFWREVPGPPPNR